MKKPWSISTTVRNPERIRDFLRVLKEFEGQPFNSDNQIKYQILLIKHKLYEPTDLTNEQKKYFDEIEKEMSFDTAKRIFNAQDYEDPAMRGRNSVAPMNKMGFCVAKDSAVSVQITSFGEYFLSENYDLGKIFLTHFLKWQLPNPDSKSFSEKDDFAIKPFIGMLHLINIVNRRWKSLGFEPAGLSKDEFSLFGPTLINCVKINLQAEKLIEYRLKLKKIDDVKKQKTFKESFKKDFARDFLKTKNSMLINTFIKNLKDYGDNAIRYFRLTKFICIRGGGFYIDLEPRRKIEIDRLLETDDAKPIKFSNVEAYRNFIVDINQPILPWETESELKQISSYLTEDIKKHTEDLRKRKYSFPQFTYSDFEDLPLQKLKEYIENLRLYRKKLQDIEIHYESQNMERIKEYAEQLKNIYDSGVKFSIELERLVALALNALDDALDIKPNYPVGDDNKPTFTAPANKPDIECYYEKFNSVCEVTMLTDRSQWFNEGQPVMRHIRDFENQNRGKTVYCLFIAPKLHRDTINTFWNAVKYEYEGTKQKIVPLTIGQLIGLLELLFELRKRNKNFKHSDLLLLYNRILEITENVSSSEIWINNIPEVLNQWKGYVNSKNENK